MKKFLAALLVLAVLLTGVWAGGSGESSGDVERLEILLSDDTLEGGAMAKAVERFNAEYADKGIQVFINEIAYGDMQTQIQNRAMARDLPALIRSGHFIQYNDLAYPLEGKLGDLTGSSFAMDGTSPATGELIAGTVNATAVGLIINKTAFDKAGVSYPLVEEDRWTWDEFMAALDQVMAANEDTLDYALVIDYSQQRIRTILYQFGSIFFDPDDSKHLVLDSPETKEAIDFILSLYEDGYSSISAGLGTENAQQMFKTGRVAAHLAGNWVITDYMENITDFEWIPVLMPYKTTVATCLGGNFLYAFDGTGQEEEAVEFIKWFFTPENYIQYCKDGNYLPGVKGIEVDYDVPGLDIFVQELNATDVAPERDKAVESSYIGKDWGNTLRDNLARAVAGEITGDEVIRITCDTLMDTYGDLYE